LILILGTGGAGAGGLVVCEAAQDNDTTLVDCLEHVSCAKVSALAIIIVCVYVYLFFVRRYTSQDLRICSKSRMLRGWKRLTLCYEQSLKLLARN
jgi:hypothetical protein